MILALSGKMGSGKNTTANIIQYIIDSKESGFNLSESNYNDYIKNNHHSKCSFKQKSFAGKLKQIVALLTGCTVEDLESQEFKKKLLGPEWEKGFKYKTFGELTPEQKARTLDSNAKYITPEKWTPDYRWLLQTIGTDALRNVVHENIWVNALMADYIKYIWDPAVNDFVLPNWIITDMRFPNELEAVEKRDGITIRVNRDNGTRAIDLNPHPSETSLDSHKFDYTIENDSDISALIEKVYKILVIEKII